jgi:hypothetical protein
MWFQLGRKVEKMCEHIVQMIGYYESEGQQISIYEYMLGGTLEQCLHGELLFHIMQCKNN